MMVRIIERKEGGSTKVRKLQCCRVHKKYR